MIKTLCVKSRLCRRRVDEIVNNRKNTTVTFQYNYGYLLIIIVICYQAVYRTVLIYTNIPKS